MDNEPKLVSLAEAAKMLGFTELYVRMLVRKGKLKTKKVPLGPESEVWKHMIYSEEVERFRTHPHAIGNKREDGRHKHTLYATDSELKAIQTLLSDNGFTEVAELLTTPSQKSAYQRRKLKKVAQLRSEAHNGSD